jgi:DNA-binding SARP family transcriptional activator
MITRARAVLTGMAAIAALALVVVGLPVVLWQFGGSPLPGHLAGWHRVATVLSSRDDGSLLFAVIRACSWLAWLLFAVCVLAEAQAAIRGRRAPHLRLGGVQGAAAHLVALATLAFATPSAITLSAAVAAVSHPGTGSQPGTASQSGGGSELGTSAPAGAGNDAAGANQPPSTGPTSALHTAPPAGYMTAPETPSAALDASAETASRLVIVRAGDCLWSLAHRYLGAGDRYPEIFTLNYGHDMGDGQVLTNPSLIEPGWQLLLPASAAAAPGPPGGPPGHHLGHPTADSHYRRRHPAARTGAANEHAVHHTGNGAAPPAPAAAHGSEGIAGNGVGNSAASAAAAGSAGGAVGDPSASSPADAGQSPYRTSASADTAGSELPYAAVFVTGALAGAVLTSLGRLRRRQRQERRRGRRIALPADPQTLAAEQRLRAAAPAEPLETLRDALACLEAGILGAGQDLPDIVGLHVTPEVLEVLLAAPAADGPPAPFAISPGRQGMCWQLDLPAIVTLPGAAGSAEAAGLAGLACHLLPGLITAGATATGYLLLDLESVQVMGCDGPAGFVDQVVSTIATELSTGQWSGWYDLVLVGCDELAALGRAEHCATVDEALDLLQARCAAVGPRIAERAPADVRELRLAEPDNEDWGLTILVSRSEPSAGQMTRLLELAEDGPGGIAALVAGDPETADGRMAPTVLQLAPDPATRDGIIANVVPLQITVRPRALAAADYDAIGSLFAVAADLADVSPDEEPYLVYGAPPWIPQAATLQPRVHADGQPWADNDGEPGFAALTDDDSEPRFAALTDDDGEPRFAALADGEPDFAALADADLAEPAAFYKLAEPPALPLPSGLEVRILGPFTITGSGEQLQPKQAELVLALALAAPAGLSNSALCSMLGADPDHPKPSDAVRQIITRTRRRLGLASDGKEYIIHAGSGQYVLHPEASLDWTQFRDLVASGRADDLRRAVSLISGQPFTGSYFWWVDIPLAETVRAELVDAAETLAEFELASGSPRAAARAARAGLMAEASAEQLWRAVMRAEHAAGNLAGVTEAWRRCLDAIEDIAPGGEPHPDTAALYRQLTMSARQRAPVR